MIINEILQDLINIGEVASFIDNVIVETEKEKGYNEVVEEIVKRLAENNLYMKLEKCKQKMREVGFLVVIGLEEIKIEVKDILEWLNPKGVKDVQKFLGLTNHYRWFIKDFAVIAKPLHNIIKKDQKWDWIEMQEKAFQELKKRFTKELVLAILDLDKKNKNRSQCVRLYNRRSFIYRV